MEYTQEFSVSDFGFWGGAKDTMDDIIAANLEDALERHLEDIFADNTPTATDINDYVWHERETIYKELGLNENGELDEDEEDEDEEEDEGESEEN